MNFCKTYQSRLGLTLCIFSGLIVYKFDCSTRKIITLHFKLVKVSRIADCNVGIGSADLVLEFWGGPEGVVLHEVDALDQQEDRQAEGGHHTKNQDDCPVKLVLGSAM